MSGNGTGSSADYSKVFGGKVPLTVYVPIEDDVIEALKRYRAATPGFEDLSPEMMLNRIIREALIGSGDLELPAGDRSKRAGRK